MRSLSLITILFLAAASQLFAQAGLTVSPGKMYFRLAPGATSSQKVVISNPNNRELEVGASISDWDYDSLGNNRMHDAGTLKTSCANWFKILPGSYFKLQPNERREVTINFTVPADADTSTAVRTAMIFLTQLNPADSKAPNGAALKVTVRMGVKIYHSFVEEDKRDIEITNFRDIRQQLADKSSTNALELEFRNTGRIWLEGKVKWELLNAQTGETTKIDDQEFYALPEDNRLIRQRLPANMKKGRYTATAVINYGDKDELKVAELDFEVI